ncbi:galactose oxidase [Gigaspora margarita]|uniref:Galactose oxidase n=1 Tax=Gigaspora margarita TaxID=4874 RepID=A0A8H4EPM3_GIGMA|nr:galactose oxidase [Gigaspora margarita]
MSIFDTTSMTWSTLPLPTDVLPRLDYSATLLPLGLIIYIGGFTKLTHHPYILHKIFELTASGIIIQPRYGHSAVLTKDGNIIIFGGASESAQVFLILPF